MPGDAFRVFTRPDGARGVRVHVTRADGALADGAVTVRDDGAGGAAFHASGRALAFNAAGALTLATARGREGVAHAPRVTFLNYAQPAFAARAVTLDPRDLDTRAFPAAVDVGIPLLVVPVASVDVLARAVLAQWRVDDLMPRVGARAVAAFAEASDGALVVRAFANALGAPEPLAFGDAALAVAAWRVDAGLAPRVDARVVDDAGDARVEGHVVAGRAPDGGVTARVSGRVARA